MTGSAENIDTLFAGDIAFAKAVEDGIIKVDGDIAKFMALEPLVPAKKTEKKPAEKKPAATPKADVKPEIKAAPAAEKKADVKPEVKTAPVAEKKPEVKTTAPAPKAKPAAKKHGKK